MAFLKVTHFSELLNSAPTQTLGKLPPEATYAQAMYCMETMEMPQLHETLDVFKDVRAKLVEVSVERVVQAIMATEIGDSFDTFEEYHRWYLGAGDVPSYPCKNRWPCIASTYEDEVITDGNHRMHSYIRDGAKTIPILSFDIEAWWAARDAWLACPASNHEVAA